jgi:hypothetical protein
MSLNTPWCMRCTHNAGQRSEAGFASPRVLTHARLREPFALTRARLSMCRHERVRTGASARVRACEQG